MEYIQAKTILSKLKQEDPYFGIAYNMNLYRGCEHGCVYCDTRSDCYQVGDISNIRVKENAIELLNKELSAKRGNRKTIGTGSMNDPYMPIEQELGLTRKALQTVAHHKFPVHIITKGDLVMRDTDILQEISKTYAAVSFTITTADDELARRLEPRASTTSARFKAIEHLAKHDVYTGVTLMPLLPFINDTKENIETIIRRAKDSGASYIIPWFGVSLRKGSREHLYDFFDKEMPGMKQKYETTFGERYMCDSPNIKKLNDEAYELIHKLGLSLGMTFYKPTEDEQLSLF